MDELLHGVFWGSLTTMLSKSQASERLCVKKIMWIVSKEQDPTHTHTHTPNEKLEKSKTLCIYSGNIKW